MDNVRDANGVAQVRLAGKAWRIPMLAARQNRIIDPLILGLLPVFAQWQDDKSGALAKLGNQQYEALLEIAYVALTRAAPELTREQFMDMPVTLPELIEAFSVIAQQTGVFQKTGEGEMTPGEVRGA